MFNLCLVTSILQLIQVFDHQNIILFALFIELFLPFGISQQEGIHMQTIYFGGLEGDSEKAYVSRFY